MASGIKRALSDVQSAVDNYEWYVQFDRCFFCGTLIYTNIKQCPLIQEWGLDGSRFFLRAYGCTCGRHFPCIFVDGYKLYFVPLDELVKAAKVLKSWTHLFRKAALDGVANRKYGRSLALPLDTGKQAILLGDPQEGYHNVLFDRGR